MVGECPINGWQQVWNPNTAFMKPQKYLWKISILAAAILSLLFQCSEDKTYHLKFSDSFQKNHLSAHRFSMGAGDKAGIVVMDARTQKIVYAENAGEFFIPASLTKLATSIYALDTLGEDFRFKTTLYSDGKLENGILSGNLTIVGGGDPVFSVEDMSHFVRGLHEKGIRKVLGKVFYLDDEIAPRMNIDPDMPKTKYYNTSFSGLNFANNIQETIRPYNKGRIFLTPPDAHSSVNWNHSNGVYPDINYKIENGQWKWIISGKYNADIPVALPVPDSGYFFAWNFYLAAKAYGVELPVPERISMEKFRNLDNSPEELVTHESETLGVIVKDLLLVSNNQWAEVLMVFTAHKQNPKIVRMEEAAVAMKEYLVKTFPDAGFEKSRIINGSGLSSQTRLTPFQILTVLSHARNRYDSQDGGNSFEEMLPVSGISGTLKSRITDELLLYRNRAKTGTLAFAIGMGGYTTTKKGNHYTYVFMKTNFPNRDLYEKDKLGPGENYKWSMNAQEEFENQILRWIKEN